jgi:hypothetical protein
MATVKPAFGFPNRVCDGAGPAGWGPIRPLASSEWGGIAPESYPFSVIHDSKQLNHVIHLIILQNQ